MRGTLWHAGVSSKFRLVAVSPVFDTKDDVFEVVKLHFEVVKVHFAWQAWGLMERGV
jgi:hypothetical protein